MMTDFTPLPALAGGILIGLSAVLLLLASGRVAGVSGILGGGWHLAWETRLGDCCLLPGCLQDHFFMPP